MSNGVAMDPSKVDKVKSWPVPTSTKLAQSFLGFASYYKDLYKISLK